MNMYKISNSGVGERGCGGHPYVVLNGIKVVKLYAWELPLQDQIENIRQQVKNNIQQQMPVFFYFRSFVVIGSLRVGAQSPSPNKKKFLCNNTLLGTLNIFLHRTWARKGLVFEL